MERTETTTTSTTTTTIWAWTRGEYTISTDRRRLDVDVIHGFLRRSYWAAERDRDTVVRSIERSLSFGLYRGETQVGFARVVTDFVTVAFLADVFVLEECRGRGLGTWLVEVVTEIPELRGVRRWLLRTQDAHGLYRKFGFRDASAENMMQRLPDG